jgi:hypothetical protein
MSNEIKYLIILGVGCIVLFVGGLLVLKIRRKPNSFFLKKWNNIQNLCLTKSEWYKAIIDADNLLDEVLRNRRYSGSTTGERMVSAQKVFTNNANLWISHNFRKKVQEKNITKFKKKEMVSIMQNYKQALIDLGVLSAHQLERAKDHHVK